ncbi:AraC family transcriptional regulator [Rhodoblastus sp.]|uniref:AraC family transcriptional regulator n=1 Tax=Rhodoblastus sp. TaxID=1962975 RepID=UPI003F94A4CB
MTKQPKNISAFTTSEPEPSVSERRMISPHFVEEALDCLPQSIAREDILNSVGLPLTVEAPISALAYGALWRAITDRMDDEFFGLGGRAMIPGSFTLMCHCALHAGTLRRALPRALRFLAVTIMDPRGELAVADGVAQIILRDSGEARSAFAYRTLWIMLHGLACWLVGRRIPLRLVDFRCPEPGLGADHRRFFGAPVRFGQKESRLAFDESFLDLPITRSERALKQFLRGAPANILVRHRHDAGLAANVRARLRRQKPSDWPGVDQLAQTLRMPPSTFRHRLNQEGLTYASIKEEIRRNLAFELLLDSPKKVSEIALELGFAEPSAFHRAFRKWTSKSPAAYRQDGGRAH